MPVSGKRARRAILLFSGVVFLIAAGLYLYGALADIADEERANISSVSAIVFIVNILASTILLRVVRDAGGD